MDLRTALAVVLGVGLGLALIARPGVFARTHTVGRLPHDRGGGYGAEARPAERSRRFVQAAGAVTVLLGLYFLAAGIGVF